MPLSSSPPHWCAQLSTTPLPSKARAPTPFSAPPGPLPPTTPPAVPYPPCLPLQRVVALFDHDVADPALLHNQPHLAELAHGGQRFVDHPGLGIAQELQRVARLDQDVRAGFSHLSGHPIYPSSSRETKVPSRDFPPLRRAIGSTAFVGLLRNMPVLVAVLAPLGLRP